jgi:hypothetical protein
VIHATDSTPQHQYREGVTEDVDDVVAGRIELPELVLDPEGRVDQRVVLGGGPEIEPDPLQSVRGPQHGVLDDVFVVVPDESVVQDGPIRHQGHGEQQTRQQRPARNRPRHVLQQGAKKPRAGPG